MKDFMDILTQDWIGINMWKVTYKYAHPSGTIRTKTHWTEAKDATEAKNKLADYLKTTKLKWWEITHVDKLTIPN